MTERKGRKPSFANRKKKSPHRTSAHKRRRSFSPRPLSYANVEANTNERIKQVPGLTPSPPQKAEIHDILQSSRFPIIKRLLVWQALHTGIGMSYTAKVVSAPSRNSTLRPSGGLKPANRHGILHHVFFTVVYSGSGTVMVPHTGRRYSGKPGQNAEKRYGNGSYESTKGKPVEGRTAGAASV